MTIMRHQTALTVGEGDVIEWRHLLLDWMPLAWLLYFLKLLTLTATYVATRSRLERQLAEQPEPIDEQSFRKAAHCRRFSTVPMGDDDENAESATLETVQSGYRTWFFGVFLYALWMLVPIVSQLQLVWLTMERYFGLGWDATAKQFILIYLISHVILFAATQYSGQVKTFFLQPSSLAEATHIAIFPRDKTKGLGRLEVVRVRHLPGSETGSGGSTTVQSRRYYEQTCVRYLWNEEARRFRPTGVKPLSGQEAYKALDGGGLAENFALERLDRQGRNAINVKVLGIFASLLAEYSQPIYIFQMMCIWCYLFFDSWNIALLWVFLVFGSGAWTSLMILRRNQQQIAEMAAAGGHRLEKVLRDGQWKDVPATDLTLGDVVQVKDGVVCADLALVAGSAVVNESMLTGEPMPLQKVSLEQNSEALFDYKTHGKKQGLFAGTEVLQSVADEASNANRGSTLALAVVVAIGARTTKGRLIRMVLYPALVKFKYTEQLPVVYAFMTLWATICFIATMTFQGQGWVNGFFVGISFLTQSMNPMMAVSFTLGQSAAALRLKEKNISCLNIGRIPIAGKISTMVFDKTGTITHGGMDLAGVRPVDEGRFEAEVSAKDLHNLEPKNVFLKALASCHTVSTMRDGSFVGNQVEIVTVKALQWRLSAPGQARVIASPDGQTQLEVLRQLEFDHHRMTSGALVRCKETQRVLAFFKGAYDKISQIADPSSVPVDYKDLCESYASQCYYVLAMSWKELQVDDAQLGDITRDSLEQGLKICGLLFFRNEMKADSREVIKELKEGGVSCVICTGDNTTTGVSIGRQCGIFSDKARVLVGELAEPDTFKPSKLHWRDADDKEAEVPHWQFDNAELALSQSAFRWLVREKPEELSEMLPSIKVFGRMKPDDKIKVINLWQDYGDGVVTGMVGDGGNDCGALRTAHAGLALSEAEASMVSPFSSSKGLSEQGFISLAAVVDLIKEGRCCLATNMATFMYFMIYNLTLTTSKMLAVIWMDSTYAEWQFMLTDVERYGHGVVYGSLSTDPKTVDDFSQCFALWDWHYGDYPQRLVDFLAHRGRGSIDASVWTRSILLRVQHLDFAGDSTPAMDPEGRQLPHGHAVPGESHGAAERWLCALLWPHSSADGGQELANLQFLHSGSPFYACSDLVESLGVQLYLPSELRFGGVAEDEPSTSQQTGGWRDLFQGQLGRLLLGPTDVELQKPGASLLGDPSEQCQLTSQLGGEKQYPSAQGPF